LYTLYKTKQNKKLKIHHYQTYFYLFAVQEVLSQDSWYPAWLKEGVVDCLSRFLKCVTTPATPSTAFGVGLFRPPGQKERVTEQSTDDSAVTERQLDRSAVVNPAARCWAWHLEF
jgi:hypothetical protein